MGNEELIRKGVVKAQEIARANGLKIGDVVAHPDDPIAYQLVSVEGDVATVWLPAEKSEDGREVRKEFPISELFNPNVALNEALRAKFGLD